jgi:hypothetical protein
MRHRGQRLDAARTRPVSIGGDHSITGPILKALAGPGRKLSRPPFGFHSPGQDRLGQRGISPATANENFRTNYGRNPIKE